MFSIGKIGLKIFISMLGDVALALVKKINWGIILERYASRQVAQGLRYLAKQNTNFLDEKTANEMIIMLEQQKLPKVLDK